MGLINFMKRLFSRSISDDRVSNDFRLKTFSSIEMNDALREWDEQYRFKKLNIASVLSSEAARLATIEFKVSFSGEGDRKEYIEKMVNNLLRNVRKQLEYGCAYGSLIIKPSKDGVEFLKPNMFKPVEFDSNGNLTSVICLERMFKGGNWFTKAEYSRYSNGVYTVENKVYVSKSPDDLGYETDITKTEWKYLSPYSEVVNVDRPLFGFFRYPSANNIDIDSPLGVSIFSRATETINSLENVWEKFNNDIDTSDKVVFVADNLLQKQNRSGKSPLQVSNPLPKLVRGLNMTTNGDDIYEFVPDVRSEQYKDAMQMLLDTISIQCGFDTGYLSFDSVNKSVVTATQIEADMQRTISTISDIQKELIKTIEDVIYSINAIAELYGITEDGKFEYNITSKDFNVNNDEDKKNALNLVSMGIIPKWKYLVDYEGYSIEDAKKLVNDVVVSDNNKVGESVNNKVNGGM